MRNLIRLEEFSLFLFSVFLFAGLDLPWWWFPVLLLAPDIGMLGYVVGNRVGAVTYNVLHHKALALGAFTVGALIDSASLQLCGVIVLGHSRLDRTLGYGLKYADSFRHTHLGWIGRIAGDR